VRQGIQIRSVEGEEEEEEGLYLRIETRKELDMPEHAIRVRGFLCIFLECMLASLPRFIL